MLDKNFDGSQLWKWILSDKLLLSNQYDATQWNGNGVFHFYSASLNKYPFYLFSRTSHHGTNIKKKERKKNYETVIFEEKLTLVGIWFKGIQISRKKA